ncbi:uncharacterized protein TNCV_3582711 [Trichonephila clavipes]|nr:uncharacterized protein TNCV_3582711 [Trichonephila clavipes]
MQKGLNDTKNELKERIEKGQEEIKQEVQKGLENVQQCQVELKNSLEEKINSVEDRIPGKMKEEVTVVEEKVGKEIERIKKQVEERIEVAGKFNQQVEALDTKLLACGKTTNENKLVPASSVSVKLPTYDGKTNWEVYKTQFCIISEANGRTERVKACQLAASLRCEAAEVLQTLPDTATEFELPV